MTRNACAVGLDLIDAESTLRYARERLIEDDRPGDAAGALRSVAVYLTTLAAELERECDVCQRLGQLRRVMAYGIETYACDECLGREPEEGEWQ